MTGGWNWGLGRGGRRWRRGIADWIVVGVLSALVGGLAPASGAADEPEVMLRLRQEYTTLFDTGMNRLRRSAIDASFRLAARSQTAPLVRVWYDPKAGRIEIQFHFTDLPGSALSMEWCQESRKAAIRETFRIGTTFYDVPVSFDERVRRRLGILFAREPTNGAKEMIALGQRLSELTYLGVRLADERGGRNVSCRDRVAPLMGAGSQAPGESRSKTP